VREEAQYWFES